MSLVMPMAEFLQWFDAFLPELKPGSTAGDFRLLEPALVTNEHDAKQVHNHGLNLSRAWCMRGIMQVLVPGSDPRWQRFGTLARDHVIAAEAAITGGEYVSTHWLISFALLADAEWHS